MSKQKWVQFSKADVLCIVQHWYFGMSIPYQTIYDSCNKFVTIESANGMIFLVGTPLTIVAREISVAMDKPQDWPSWKFTTILKHIIYLSKHRDSYLAHAYQNRLTSRMGKGLWSSVSHFHICPPHITNVMQCGHDVIKLFIASAYRRLLQIHLSSDKVQDLITLAITDQWEFLPGVALELLLGFTKSCQIECRACTNMSMCDIIVEGTLYICIARRDRILLAILFLCEQSCDWLVKLPPTGAPLIFTHIYSNMYKSFIVA